MYVMKTLQDAADEIKNFSEKNLPAILTAASIAGGVATTVLAVKLTPRASEVIAAKKKELSGEKSTVKKAAEIAYTTAKMYAPAIVLGAASIGCAVGSYKVSAGRIAALAAAYSFSESRFKSYRDKVVETIGEKKEKVIRDEVEKEEIKKNPVSKNEIYDIGRGDVLCYDDISGRYFRSSVDKIKSSVNELNKRMLSDMYISLNEFYYEIGLPPVKMGEDLGFNMNEGFIDIHFSPILSDTDEPCLCMSYTVYPRFDYRDLY